MKRFLAVLLAVLLVVSLCACSSSSSSTSTDYTGMDPTEAAEQAAEATADKTSLSDIIRVPFGYLLEWLNELTSSYGIALILFSLIVKIVLLPAGMKSKKSSMKMSRLAPEVKALEAKYAGDQQKYQLAVNELYKEEGVSMGGGCLWSFIPLLILLPLYYVIREPITYMLHNSRSVSAAIVAYMQASGVSFGSNSFYSQLTAASHIGEFIDELKGVALFADAKLKVLNFSFLGVNLASIPTWRVWNCSGWSEIGLFLIPIISAGAQMLSMLITQKMNNDLATDQNGEKDAEAAKAQNQSMMSMMIMMPLMSLWIGYSMPAAISIYWIAQAVFSLLQEVVLSGYYRKEYEAEDAARRERAAKRAAEEAEKERLRAERRAANPNAGDSTSKKKLKTREREENRKNGPVGKLTPEEREALRKEMAVSGDPDRPYSRGRAYVADRYGKDGTELILETEAPVVDDYVEPEESAETENTAE